LVNILPSMKQITAEGKIQHRLHNVISFHVIQCFQEEKLENLLMPLVQYMYGQPTPTSD